MISKHSHRLFEKALAIGNWFPKNATLKTLNINKIQQVSYAKLCQSHLYVKASDPASRFRNLSDKFLVLSQF
jgi:hypothetical protein